MVAGDTVLDLGPGAEPFKYWYTEKEVTLQGHLLSRRGLRPFHTPAQLLSFATRQATARVVGRIRRLLWEGRSTTHPLRTSRGSPV